MLGPSGFEAMTDEPDPDAGNRPADDSGRRTARHHSSAETSDSRIGKVFGGRYRIEDRIGAGGMGVVYLARHTSLDRPVVVKVLTQERLQDETSLQRFEREAKSLSRLDHLNIVTVYDFGREGDLSYLAMEYVDGVELHALIEQQGWLSMNLFAPIASQILDGVGHAHNKGLVHRDLKPSNIMLTERDESPYFVKLLDFGLAKLVSGDIDVTQKDSILGSIPYLSPEQIAGSDIDQRVDVYSLGVVFYYMLTGRKPFRGSEASIVYDQVHSEPPPISLHLPDNSRVPKPVTELIHECLAKHPDNRPDSAYDVLDRLQAVTSEFRPPSSGSHRAPSDRSSPDGGQPISSEYVGDHDTRDPRREATERGGSAASQSGAQPAASEDRGGGSGLSIGWLVGGILFGLLMAATAVGTWSLASSSSDDASAAATESTDESESVDARLDRIDGLIDDQKFSTASSRLDALAAEADGDESREQIEQRRERLEAARLYAEAKRQRETGEIEEAIATYAALLEVAPNYRDTTARLAELEAYGKLAVESDEAATLRIDDNTVGEPPLTTPIPPGEHEVVAESDEGASWSSSVTVDENETVSLTPSFDDDESKTAEPPSDPKPEPDPEKSDDESDSEETGTARRDEKGEDETPAKGSDGSDDSQTDDESVAEAGQADSDQGDDSVLLESGSSDDDSSSSDDDSQLLPVD